MELTEFTNVDPFLDRTRPYLEREEAFSGLAFGIALRLREASPTAALDGDPHPPTTAAREGDPLPPPLLLSVSDGDEPILVGVMTPPHRLVLYGMARPLGEAVDLVVDHLLECGRVLPGVNGPSAISGRFARAWSRRASVCSREGVSMEVYELRQVTPVDSASGSMRAATAADLDLLVRWMICFNRDVGMPSDDEAAMEQAVQNRIDRGALFVWEDAGRVVSMAGAARPTPHGMAVNAVYTPPELRRRGYAASCVAVLSQLLLDSGREFCTLFADRANSTSNGVYRRIGYQPLGSFTQYDFGG